MEMDKTTQEAYDKLKTTLEFSENVDLSVVLSVANTRINRLQDQLNNTLSIGPKAIRKLALKLLDNDNGIRKDIYEVLSIMLIQSNNEDILENVDMTDDVAYVGEDYAEIELKKIEENE